MFDKLVWHTDRMLLDDLVFRPPALQKCWLGPGRGLLYILEYKPYKPLVDQYAKLWSLRSDFRPIKHYRIGHLGWRKHCFLV